jgi:hypothetical protein
MNHGGHRGHREGNKNKPEIKECRNAIARTPYLFVPVSFLSPWFPYIFLLRVLRVLRGKISVANNFKLRAPGL